MKVGKIIMDCLLMIPVLMVLSTVFVIDKNLANGVVSGKYFWFYTSMGVLSIVTLIFAFSRKSYFLFNMQDFLVLLFVGSILLSSFVFNDASQNTTKLVVLALLVVLYFTLLPLNPLLKGTLAQHNARFYTPFVRRSLRLRRVKNKVLLCKDTSQRLAFSNDVVRDYAEQRAKATNLLIMHSKSPLGDLGVYFIVLTGLIEAVWGLRQLYGFSTSQHPLFKLTGSFFNPGPYAGYLAVVFPLALYFGVHGTGRKVQGEWQKVKGIRCRVSLLPFAIRLLPQILACVTYIAILLVLPAAMSRASWLAVIAGSLVVLCGHYSDHFSYFKNYYGKYKKKILPIGFIVLVSLFAALSGMYFLKKDSADGRSLMWKIALQTATKHPLGVGLGNFSGAYGDEQAAYFASGKGTKTEEYVAGCPEYGFNEYLQIAVESGVISLGLFLAIVFLSLQSCFISREWGIAGSMVSLLVFAFFSYPFSLLPLLIIFVFLLANSTRITQIYTDNHLKSAQICVICALSICLSITALCLYKAYPAYQAYKKWNTSKIYYGAGLYKDVAKNYEELYPLLNDQIQFLFEYAQSLSKSEQYTKSNEILKRAMQISCDPMLYNIEGKNYQALKEYDRAEACFIKASNITPNRLYPFYLLTKLYHEMGLQDKVNEMADIVQTKEPKVHSRAVEEMRIEVKKLRIKN
ncbi:MAG: O-antigen ligase family protein [Candidatus Azobacteroides sp.]|nr:O-antigen ligase family protein [Candidatus Azobacteroides sp.]